MNDCQVILDMLAKCDYFSVEFHAVVSAGSMILSFKNKGLKELFETGRTAKLDRKLQTKARLILDALDRAKVPSSMAIPGFDFHSLKGFQPTRYSCHVNGPWCITFEFDGENVARVEYEQYH